MAKDSLKGFIKGITTRTAADKKTGIVAHTTTFRVVCEDLDQETLEALAVGEFEMRMLSFELVARGM